MKKKEVLVEHSNGFGIASFVLGIIAIVFSFLSIFDIIFILLAIIFGIIQIKIYSNVLAKAGLIMGIIAIILVILFTYWYTSISLPDEENLPTDDFQEIINQKDNPGQFNIEEIKNKIVLVKYEFSAIDMEGFVVTLRGGGSGVITKNGTLAEIYTNRHAVDCIFSGQCFQIINESFSIITYDGKSFSVKYRLIANHDIDLAILKIDSNEFNYPSSNFNENLKINEEVIVAGYPSFNDKYNEVSTSPGYLLNIRELMSQDGYKFNIIESDAYANYGSSGGGIFDIKGNILGITTWKSEDNAGSGISLKNIINSNQFIICPKESYFNDNYKKCIEYCDGLFNGSSCIQPCKDFYCAMKPINGGDDRCPDSTMIKVSSGGVESCMKPCKDSYTACPGAQYCYKNQCNYGCDRNYLLYEDGQCYYSAELANYNYLTGKAINNNS